jgi:hypothetical protein
MKTKTKVRAGVLGDELQHNATRIATCRRAWR